MSFSVANLIVARTVYWMAWLSPLTDSIPMVRLRRVWCTSSLPLLQGPLWPGMVVLVKVLTMGQISLFGNCIWDFWYHIRGAFNRFPDFFVQAFEIVIDSWKFTMLLLYILWDDWPIFMISDSNQQLQQQLEYTLLKPDCHSWWISKMQSGREDTLKERYAIKFCFELGKNATETNIWNASDCFSTILHELSISFWVA